jgi:predicted dehydrogenase
MQFVVEYFGERGRLKITDQALEEQHSDEAARLIPLPAASPSIEGDFVAGIAGLAQPSCSAREALESVRVLDAIARSAATGEIVRLTENDLLKSNKGAGKPTP